MGARKKKDEAAFTVVVENLLSQFKAFGEALQGLSEKTDRGFAGVDARFEKVDARFDAVDARFDAVDARSDRIEGDLALVKAAVLEHSREIREMRGEIHEVRGTVTRIELALSKKVDRDEVEAIVVRVLAR